MLWKVIFEDEEKGTIMKGLVIIILKSILLTYFREKLESSLLCLYEKGRNRKN